MNSIDFSRSRAILVGTARYTHGLAQMRAAHNSLATMRELLIGPLCGWPPERVTTFEDKTTRYGLNQQIAKLIHDTTDVLLFYYVGHGQLLDGEDLGLALVDTHTEPHMRRSTSLCLNALRTELKHQCRARVKLVILDCCFSGIATRNTKGAGLADQVRAAAEVEGAYTLTASRASQKALHQDGPDGLTYFTKIFAEVVRDGIPGAGAKLTLKDIHRQVAARFQRLDLPDGQLRPEPSVLAVDTAEELVLARNAAPPREIEPEAEPPRLAERILSTYIDRSIEITDMLGPSLATISRAENRSGWHLLKPVPLTWADSSWPIRHHSHRVGILKWVRNRSGHTGWELATPDGRWEEEQQADFHGYPVHDWPFRYLLAPPAKWVEGTKMWADPADALLTLAGWHYCPHTALTTLFRLVNEGTSPDEASRVVHIVPAVGEHLVQRAQRSGRPLLDQVDEFLPLQETDWEVGLLR